MEYIIREIEKEEYLLLDDFLYETNFNLIVGILRDRLSDGKN